MARHFVTLAGDDFVNQFDWPSSRTDLPANATSGCVFLWKMLVIGLAPWCNSILKVSVKGRLHTANELLLLRDSEPLEITRAEVKEYR